jgi:hypothetical protein
MGLKHGRFATRKIVFHLSFPVWLKVSLSDDITNSVHSISSLLLIRNTQNNTTINYFGLLSSKISAVAPNHLKMIFNTL